MLIIQKTIYLIAEPLMHIFNFFFKNGVFPNSMKLAKVIPIYQKGKKNDMSNYRPISLLPQLSKILENIFAKRLSSFISTNKSLINCQYSFQKKLQHHMCRKMLLIIYLHV